MDSSGGAGRGMSSFAERCGIHDGARQACIQQLAQSIAATGVELVRFAWCDQPGVLRGKTLVASAAVRAMTDGVGMVGTLLLKDTSDHTAYTVFEPPDQAAPPGFACAANLVLLADPHTYRQLPWAADTGWVLCQPWFQDGSPVHLDTRRVSRCTGVPSWNHGWHNTQPVWAARGNWR